MVFYMRLIQARALLAALKIDELKRCKSVYNANFTSKSNGNT